MTSAEDTVVPEIGTLADGECDGHQVVDILGQIVDFEVGKPVAFAGFAGRSGGGQ